MEIVKYGKFLDHGQAKRRTYQTKYSCTQLCQLDFEVAGQRSLSPPELGSGRSTRLRKSACGNFKATVSVWSTRR